jgi:hypothetical protein
MSPALMIFESWVDGMASKRMTSFVKRLGLSPTKPLEEFILNWMGSPIKKQSGFTNSTSAVDLGHCIVRSATREDLLHQFETQELTYLLVSLPSRVSGFLFY